MQQTLLRILLTDWFSIELREGIRFIGVGFLVIPWTLLGLYEFWSARKNQIDAKSQLGSLITWGIVAVAILCIPLIAGNLPIDSVPVFGWGFMIVLGFLAAILFSTPRAERIGIPKEVIWDMCTQLFIAGIIGSRVFHLIQYRELVFKDKQGFELITAALNFADGGMVFFGGVIAGILAYLRFCKVRNIPMLVMADLMAPALLLGLAFGRLGCLMNGCCYGDVCELPWAITFPPGSPPFEAMIKAGELPPDATKTLPLHPTQIYSSISALLLTALTTIWFRRRSRDGEVLALALLTYPIARFVIEIVRNDEVGQFNTALTISQWISIGMFCSGLLLLYVIKTGPPRLTPLPLKLNLPTKEEGKANAAST